jgi:hypothetical protein
MFEFFLVSAFIIIPIIGIGILLAGVGLCIDEKCPPYNGMTKKETREYIKQFIREHPEYTEDDFCL